ncbi:hypothetical protein E2562_009463 [Oryza meyeriana var. granulata]|uniref:Uncharacterized protein n=1 Tax=Oryza meyeriana var. granulata TaxID=110450 RepID=A0A6G1BU68_9ORYZ|nr:hypothetical protein E2562_009463 [Oryza meyeriana var. granulata]
MAAGYGLRAGAWWGAASEPVSKQAPQVVPEDEPPSEPAPRLKTVPMRGDDLAVEQILREVSQQKWEAKGGVEDDAGDTQFCIARLRSTSVALFPIDPFGLFILLVSTPTMVEGQQRLVLVKGCRDMAREMHDPAAGGEDPFNDLPLEEFMAQYRD